MKITEQVFRYWYINKCINRCGKKKVTKTQSKEQEKKIRLEDVAYKIKSA